MRNLSVLVLSLSAGLSAGPAMAAAGPFLSLQNTNFIVLLAFLLFVGVLVHLKVPGMIGGILDKRAEGIRAELDEARALREEAQTVLASYERKQKEVQQQAERIIATAREEAQAAAEQAKEDLKQSIARRLAAAVDQIASAEASAVKEVRDQAITIAMAAAGQVLAKQMTEAKGNKMIEAAIGEVEAKLH
ncbi:MAG TPA: F0F1 ATP synthase subunit B [Roseibacterium sp.]|nr:F0F1 ATP synthase subunit B [Roseibacterium sp.]